jgi:hypothetical protein
MANSPGEGIAANHQRTIMTPTSHLLARLGILSLLVVLPAASASAQSNLGKSIVDKVNAGISKLEAACATDIKKYCKDVTPGEGRMLYCMEAYEDKISAKCDFALGEAVANVQATMDMLKDGVVACKAEIAGVCGKVLPGEGRIANCLIDNKSTASKGCADAVQKVLDAAAAK